MKVAGFVVLALCAVSYVQATATCERRWKKVGCYQDNFYPERPLSEELVNRRDPVNNHYDGHMISWTDYPGTIHSLYCKCAELTEAKGYTHFGLQFYGECWSGPSAESRYSMMGTSDKCIGVDYQPCVKADETECIGKDATNYIYQLVKNTTKGVVDGGYTEWSSWAACSRSCGGGFKIRQRACTNPSPSNGGNDCSSSGDSEQMSDCGDDACPSACTKAIELGIIMDASSSVRMENYNKVKDFLKKLSEDFTISTKGTHFGIIHYSSYARLDFRTSDARYQDRMPLKAKISTIIYSYGGTRTDRALRLAERELFCPSCTRPGKPKVLLVITDGNTNPGSEDLTVASQTMKTNGVTIISLGVGQKISNSELVEIATGPEHVFQIATFDMLKDKLSSILNSCCSAK